MSNALDTDQCNTIADIFELEKGDRWRRQWGTEGNAYRPDGAGVGATGREGVQPQTIRRGKVGGEP